MADEIYWMPQPGPQTEAFTCPADEIFFGGSRGGGKSDCAIGRQIDGAMRHGVKWNGMMVRKKYKDFREIRRRFDELIIHGLPAKRVGGDQQLNFIRFKNGANVILSAMGSVEAADDWVGHQFTEISFEEAPQLPYIGPLIDKLKGSLRSPHGVPTHIFMTGNPGGPGASQIKAMFIPIENGGDLENVKEGRVNWVDVEQEDGTTVTVSRVFIRSDLRDNKILCDNDPKYVNTLLSIQDPARRAAWIEGRWDVFIGQAFDFSTKNIVQNPIWPIPEFAPVFMTFDWGFGAPFSVIWSWIDSDGRIYACREWYGERKKGLPNVGLRMTDQQIIEGILEREEQYGLLNRNVTWLLGPDCFRKKANYMGGGQGPATSDEWAAYLARPDIIKKYGDLAPIRKMIPGDATKETKIRQFRNRIASDPSGTTPMLMVYPECQSLIKTIPTLCTAETNVEELEDGQEDHCLVGATLVDTDKGQIPIKDLVGTSGKVLTAGGFWTDYSNCRLTIKQADVVKVTFEDGRSITCTPTHRFLAVGSHQWVDAQDLTDVTCRINLSEIDYMKETDLCKSKLLATQFKSLMESDITSVENTSNEKECDCTESSGSITMGQSPKVSTFITEMQSKPIIKSKTSVLGRCWPTWLSTLRNKIIQIGSKLCRMVQSHGIAAKLVKNGINGIMKSIAKIKCTKKLRNLVNSVRSRLLAAQMPVSVPTTALNGNGSFKMNTTMAFVSSVEPPFTAADKLVQRLAHLNYPTTLKATKVESAGKADVYCLTAAHTNAFSVECGIIVHNSYDSICHVCQFHPIGTPQPIIGAIQKQRQSEAKKKKLDSASRAALEEWERTMDELAGIEDSPAWLT